ncbi:uncharacterized protein EI90DRAFT_3029624 [Cantharellus anzutake]|uniref:uncharacterized protein n=1 Tax=Cantharellus anzutake TaxID=1750568 RepID=UPI0019064E72|nr:uncharacterized protein EI90DRAFT_3029624 [Cantharellus anzutake]KAF8342618.1 hypothetical protein EI90DRAFT_3029624 [Cantharellus anzutake]
MDDLPGSTGKIAETRITHPIGVTAGMPAFQASSPLPLLDERDRGDQINNCAMDDSIAAQPKHRDDGSLSHSPIRSGDAHPSIIDGICSGSAQQRDHALSDRANAEIDVERSYDGLEDWLVDDAYSLAQGSGDRACDSRASISSAESPRQSSLSNKADHLQGASISPRNLYKTYRSVGIQVGAAVDIRAPRRYSSAPPS